jgi:putative ABC transport system permease protein
VSIRVAFREAALTIATYRFRSLTTALSMALGCAAVILMASVARSALHASVRGLEDMGAARLVLLSPKATGTLTRGSDRKQFEYRDIQALAESLDQVDFVAGYTVSRDVRLTTGARPGRRSDHLAVNELFWDVFNLRIGQGRGILASDVERRQRVAVLSEKVAVALFGSSAGALGSNVRVAGLVLQVVGVASEVDRPGAGFGFDWNNFVAMPLTLRPQAMVVALSTANPEANSGIVLRARQVLAQLPHPLRDLEAEDFGEFMKNSRQGFALLEAVAALLAAVTLLVSGVGIMDVVNVSVDERTREIGIRRALGASQAAIRAQTLAEALLIALGGALTGSAVGVGLHHLTGWVIRASEGTWQPLLSHGAVLGSCAAAILLGLVFSVQPARRASSLEVVDCLRNA